VINQEISTYPIGFRGKENASLLSASKGVISKRNLGAEMLEQGKPHNLGPGTFSCVIDKPNQNPLSWPVLPTFKVLATWRAYKAYEQRAFVLRMRNP
jgi:hypothetical protein